jgi:outer membrane protein assembly factor BamB
MRLHHLAILSALVASAAAQTDWSMFQGGPEHTGFLAVTLNPSTFNVRYTRLVSNSTGTQFEPVTVADGKVFVSGSDRVLRALDAATGAEIWQVPFPTANSVNPPSYANGRVYVQTGNHASDTYLRCFNANTGALVFQTNHLAQWERYYAPTIRDGGVWVAGGSYGGMYSFDAVSGQQRWFAALPQYDEWTPAVDIDTAYAYSGGTMFALNRATGAERYRIVDPFWSWQGYSMYMAPVLGGQNDLFAVQSGRLIRFDLNARTVAWQQTGTHTGQPAVHAGQVFALNANSLQVREQATGTLLWSWARPGENLIGNVIVTNNHVLVRGTTKTFVIDRTTRTSAYEVALTGEITIGQGAIFLAGTNGTISSIGFSILPTTTNITPAARDYLAPDAPVTVRGNGFSQGTGLTVKFGDALATQVTVVDDQTLTCVPPALGPGVVSITTENSNGRAVRQRAFAYTPAVDHIGDTFVGSAPTLSFHQPTGHAFLAGFGAPPRTALFFPQFVGMLEIIPVSTIFWTPYWMTNRMDLPLPIPADPALRGQTVLIQSVSGLDMFATGEGKFSNCYEITVR